MLRIGIDKQNWNHKYFKDANPYSYCVQISCRMNSFGNASKDTYTEAKAESERGENIGEKRKVRGSREEDDEKVL